MDAGRNWFKGIFYHLWAQLVYAQINLIKYAARNAIVKDQRRWKGDLIKTQGPDYDPSTRMTKKGDIKKLYYDPICGKW